MLQGTIQTEAHAMTSCWTRKQTQARHHTQYQAGTHKTICFVAYSPHQINEWCLDMVALVLDDLKTRSTFHDPWSTMVERAWCDCPMLLLAAHSLSVVSQTACHCRHRHFPWQPASGQYYLSFNSCDKRQRMSRLARCLLDHPSFSVIRYLCHMMTLVHTTCFVSIATTATTTYQLISINSIAISLVTLKYYSFSC